MILCLGTSGLKAQMLSAVGAAVGITYGTHEWNPSAFNTQERYLLGFNAAGLVEFFHNPTFRWRVEAEYNQMGSKELIYSTLTNRTTYITLNNYLKIQYRLVHIMPYFLIGPRVEYLLSNGPQVYPSIIGAFPKFWFTAAAGVGVEFINKSLFRPFIEGFYNRDILPSYNATGTIPYYGAENPITDYNLKTTIFYHGFEARIGFRYVFDNSSAKGKCPTVINPAGS